MKAQEIAGSIGGDFQVNQSGSATYTVALSVPPGTAGMIPNLSLNYDSGSGSSFVGQGWSLGGLPIVSRCPASLAIDGYYGGEHFRPTDRFCLDGQRLVAVAGSEGGDGTEYRTRIESFTKVTSHGGELGSPQYFKAYLKSGLIYELGVTSNSRLISNSTAAISWHVNRVSDRSGNY